MPTTNHWNELSRAISEITNKPTNCVIYSHAYSSYLPCKHVFHRMPLSWPEKTWPRNYIARSATTNASFLPPIPIVTFQKIMLCRLESKFANWAIIGVIIYLNIFIYAQLQKVLMLVDMISKMGPFPYLAIANVVSGFKAQV